MRSKRHAPRQSDSRLLASRPTETASGIYRLISVTVSGTTTTYGYDHQSRRIRKATGAAVTRFIYDGWNMIAEYAGSTLKRSYTWGMDLSGSMQGAGGVGGLLSITEASGNGSVKAGQTLYPTYDGNGNITRILDSSSNVVCSYGYDPFGNFENPTGNDADSSGYAAEQPFGFSTKYHDEETGLYYYGYRYYDPNVGRWPSRDPIEENGGPNLYAFTYNSPPNFIDVGGLANYKLGSDDPAYTPDKGAGAHGSIPATFKGHLLQRIARGGAYGAGMFADWDVAKNHLNHYLDNSGADMDVDLKKMLNEVKSAQAAFDSELGLAAAFAETLADGKHDITSGGYADSRLTYNTKEESKDWFYAVGGYKAWGKGTVEVTGDTICMTFNYKMRDRYNWDGGKEVEMDMSGWTDFGRWSVKKAVGTSGPLRVDPGNNNTLIIEDRALGRLHLMGLAKEYEMSGATTKRYVWKRGGAPTLAPPSGGGGR